MIPIIWKKSPIPILTQNSKQTQNLLFRSQEKPVESIKWQNPKHFSWLYVDVDIFFLDLAYIDISFPRLGICYLYHNGLPAKLQLSSLFHKKFHV